MLDKTIFEVDLKPRETSWALDPAVDLGASDLAEWQETGGGLVARPGETMSKIRWRPLTLPEQSHITLQTQDGGRDGYGLLVLAVAHGLLSIDGLRVRTDPVPTGRRASVDTIASFERLRGEVPGVGVMSPIAWLGGLIIKASFRDGG